MRAVEVANTSLDYDRTKLALTARSGIPEADRSGVHEMVEIYQVEVADATPRGLSQRLDVFESIAGRGG